MSVAKPQPDWRRSPSTKPGRSNAQTHPGALTTLLASSRPADVTCAEKLIDGRRIKTS
jgi:hypothetical protein